MNGSKSRDTHKPLNNLEHSPDGVCELGYGSCSICDLRCYEGPVFGHIFRLGPKTCECGRYQNTVEGRQDSGEERDKFMKENNKL